ncbi:uncharacterized protein [Amphiura filiformis]|uniref:uncharacterized protein n=1 Tax=Amphiura filiformis TaxID=82378 RepID=UPI003B223902
MSPKLFVATLEEIFKRLNWVDKGINVNGKKLNHLMFADDIVIISGDAAELEEMLTDLSNESRKVGLKMNMSKTKVMFNMYADNKEIKIENETLEHVSKIHLPRTRDLARWESAAGNKEKNASRMDSFQQTQRYTNRQTHAKLSEKETFQSMHLTCHNIWK